MADPSSGARNAIQQFCSAMLNVVETPVTWFRERIVEPNRPKYYYYHRQFRRVPTIDECYVGDHVCYYEAQEQFRRDREVDGEILSIVRLRRDDCIMYEKPDHRTKCASLMDAYDEAATNFFIKYGDLGAYGNVKDAYMKQKHRLIWERRKIEREENQDNFS